MNGFRRKMKIVRRYNPTQISFSDDPRKAIDKYVDLPDTLALIDGEILAEQLDETKTLPLVEALAETFVDR